MLAESSNRDLCRLEIFFRSTAGQGAKITKYIFKCHKTCFRALSPA